MQWRNDEDDRREFEPKIPKLIQDDGGYGSEDIVVVFEEHSPERGSKGRRRQWGRKRDEVRNGDDNHGLCNIL